MGGFEADRDITIQASPSPDGRGLLLRSEGLARRGRAELEIIHLPEAQAKNAAVVINQIADYVVNKSAVRDGERIAITSKDGALVARLQPGPTAAPAGFFASLFGATARVQRVSEPVDGM